MLEPGDKSEDGSVVWFRKGTIWDLSFLRQVYDPYLEMIKPKLVIIL